MTNDLSPAARELVDSHRATRMLTPIDRKRIKQKLMLRVAALGVTTAVAGKAAGMSLASKVVVVALAVTTVTGAVSVSLWALRARAPSDLTPSATSVRTSADVVATAPGPAGAPAVAAPPSARVRAPAATPPVMADPASAPVVRTSAATPRVTVAARPRPMVRGPATPPAAMAAPARSPSTESAYRDHVKTIHQLPAASAPEIPAAAATLIVPPDPEPELRALREARDDLRAGRPASAYRRLEDFDRQQGGGMLAQERTALSAIALCQWQPGPQAQARAAEFLRRSPDSPLAVRVRSACEQARQASP
jgi:hypothetical protein